VISSDNNFNDLTYDIMLFIGPDFYPPLNFYEASFFVPPHRIDVPGSSCRVADKLFKAVHWTSQNSGRICQKNPKWH